MLTHNILSDIFQGLHVEATQASPSASHVNKEVNLPMAIHGTSLFELPKELQSPRDLLSASHILDQW